MPFEAGGTRCLKVVCLVTDQDAAIRMDWETGEEVRDHSRAWLASIAHATISLDCAFRVFRAVLERVDMCSESGHIICHPAVQGLHVALFVKTPCDARLIADDEREVSCIVDRL